MRRRETAPGHFLAAAPGPGHFDILPAGRELDQLAQTAIERFRLRTFGEVHREDSREMPRPFTFHEIFVIAGSDNVTSLNVSLINPIFIKQHLVLAAATEAAVNNMVTAFERLPNSFANDQAAGTQMFAQHAKAPDLSFGRELMDNPGDGRAVAENIPLLAGDNRYLEILINDRNVIGEG